MGGINDIKAAFNKMAPGIDLRAVRMSYDEANQKQLLEFDICGADGSKRTIKEELSMGAGMRPLLDVAMKVAKALGADVTVAPEVPPVPTTEIAQKAAEGITKLFGDARIVEDSPLEPIGHPEPVKLSEQAIKQIEHEGETYELAVDGKPKSLFF
jgi:hypothetical protein